MSLSDPLALAKYINSVYEPVGKVNDGSVVIDNIDITAKAHRFKVRQKVAMVFQNFNLYAHKTIIDNLTLAPIKVMGVSKTKRFVLAWSI